MNYKNESQSKSTWAEACEVTDEVTAVLSHNKEIVH